MQTLFLKKFGFLRSTQKFAKSFSFFVQLLSKRQNHEEGFFQILFASQKVRTLANKIFNV